MEGYVNEEEQFGKEQINSRFYDAEARESYYRRKVPHLGQSSVTFYPKQKRHH